MKGTRYATSIVFALCAALALTLGGCASTGGTGEGPAASGGKKAPAGYRYVCNCGQDCKCGSNAAMPGNCACGKPMVLKKVLAENEAKIVTCGCSDAVHDALDSKDNSLCSGGKPLKGFPKKGNYSCACSGCNCGMQASNPGKCTCGKDMVPQQK